MATRNDRQLASAPSRPRKSLLRTRKLVGRAFDDTPVSIGGTLAAYTAIALIAARREGQSRNTLTSGDIIGQTKDIPTELFSIDPEHDCGLLRRLAQEEDLPLHDGGHKLVDAEHPIPT